MMEVFKEKQISRLIEWAFSRLDEIVLKILHKVEDDDR